MGIGVSLEWRFSWNWNDVSVLGDFLKCDN